MLAIICWYWKGRYTPDHVHRLYEAVRRNLTTDFGFFCLTDDAASIRLPRENVLGLPYNNGLRNGRRMWIFSDEARRLLNPRFDLYDRILQIDIDCVITGDLTPLLAADRNMHVIRIWKQPMNTRFRYGLNPSFMLLKPGHFDSIWQDYKAHPDRRIGIANRAGWPASDQAIISQTFSDVTSQVSAVPIVPVWTSEDGLYAFQEDLHCGVDPLPSNARFVSFHGRYDPSTCSHIDWVKKYWLDLA